jgi:hypothetical protein
MSVSKTYGRERNVIRSGCIRFGQEVLVLYRKHSGARHCGDEGMPSPECF